ncbi:MAG: hypothetical protein KBC95_02300 [Candidatus Peribacteraceae bacterium]|nr:hypothetical protein [Candidatus Peribacteraceae bacterium]
MRIDEDDDLLPSLSSAEYFANADHGKQKHLEQKAAAKGQLLQLKREALRGQIGKGDLKSAEQREHDEKEATDRAAEEKSANPTAGTKSTAQEAKDQVLEAQDVQTSDQLVQDAKRTAAVEKAAGQEYQQDLG